VASGSKMVASEPKAFFNALLSRPS
jgi:hypothetical protein